MRRIRDPYCRRCPHDLLTYWSPSRRIQIDACESCGERVSVDGRVGAVGDLADLGDDLRRAALTVPAVPAAELRYRADGVDDL